MLFMTSVCLYTTKTPYTKLYDAILELVKIRFKTELSLLFENI